MLESSFKGVGGLNIFTRTWRPAEAPRGVVVISHGFNAHSGQYLWVADQFLAQGLAVYALDHRGRGKSEGERFYVDKFEDYEDDLTTFVSMAKAENPGLPVFLLGHSAGGVIACNYVLDHQAELNGFICEDFAYQIPAPDFVLAVFKGLSYVAPHFQALTLKNELFSRDPAAVDALNNDPLIAGESQPLETLAAMVRADERLKTGFSQITLPVLIIHGAEDKVTKPSGSQAFYDNVGSTDKTLKLYEGTYHDPLHDINKELVMSDIVNWVNERIPAETSSGAGV
jgi:acylglycerol lipase